MLTRQQFVAKYSTSFGCKSAFLVAGKALLQPGNKAGTVQHASPLWLASHHKVSSVACIWVPGAFDSLGCRSDSSGCQGHLNTMSSTRLSTAPPQSYHLNLYCLKILTTSQLAASPRCPAAKRKEFVAVRPTTFFNQIRFRDEMSRLQFGAASR